MEKILDESGKNRQTILQVTNLKKSFGGIDVLKNISFCLKKGEVLAIIGSSGGGKSTLLKVLNFLEIADEGAIVVDGKVVFDSNDKAHLPQNEEFGLVFQNFNLFPHLDLLSNLTLASKLKKVSKNEREQKARQLLEQVGLSGKEKSYPATLSGGMQQRAAIARALMQEPKILCFDEPTSSLDPLLTQEVLKVIVDLKKQGRSMIVVTHEMAFAKNVADNVIFVDDGEIAEMGTPTQIFCNPQNAKTKLFVS